MDFRNITYEAIGVGLLGFDDNFICLAVFYELTVFHNVNGVGNVSAAVTVVNTGESILYTENDSSYQTKKK